MGRGEPKARLHSDATKSDVGSGPPPRSARHDSLLDPSARIGEATVRQPGGWRRTLIHRGEADRNGRGSWWASCRGAAFDATLQDLADNHSVRREK